MHYVNLVELECNNIRIAGCEFLHGKIATP